MFVRKYSKICLVTLLCLLCLLITGTALAEIPENSPELTLDTNKSISVAAGKETYVRFTAETAGLYSFTTNSHNDVRITAYSVSGDTLVRLFFRENQEIILPIQAGETRYFGVRFVNNVSGSFSVKISCIGTLDSLTLGEQKTAEVDGERLTYFAFTAQRRGNYFFHSVTDEDTYGYRYSLEDGCLTEEEADDDDGEGSNFQLIISMNAGQTCYFGVRYYNESVSGSFPVIIEEYKALVSNVTGDDIEWNGSAWQKHQVYGQSSVLTVEAESQLGDITWTWLCKEDGLYFPVDGATGGSLTVPADITNPTQYACIVSDGTEEKRYDFIVYPEDDFEDVHAQNEYLETELGGAAEMTAIVSSASGMHTYQWFEVKYTDDGTGRRISYQDPVPGADQDTYTAENIVRETEFVCRATLPLGGTADVGFHVSPVWSVSAYGNTSISVRAGRSARLKVKTNPADAPLSFQWYADEDNTPISGAETNELTLENIQRSGRYRCSVTDYDNRQEEVYFDVSIIDNVYAYAAYNGWVDYQDSCTLTVETYSDNENEIFSYKWYGPMETEGGTAQVISGATANALEIPRVTKHCYYYCIVTTRNGFNNRIDFEINVSNDLEAYPDDDYYWTYAGEGIEISVWASCNTGDLSYQWYGPVPNGQPTGGAAIIEGATEPSYTVTDWLSSRDTYLCRVTDDFDNYITVTVPVEISSDLYAHAANDENYITTGYDQPAEMTVDADAYGQTAYQWYRKEKVSDYLSMWSILDGETEAALTVEHVTEPADYRCLVTDQIGSESDYVDFRVEIDNEFEVSWENQYIDAYADESVNLTVSASHIGGTFSYQWYAQEWDDYGNSDYRRMEGETESSVTISNHACNNRNFFCQVTDATGEQANSGYFQISVDNGFSASADNSEITADPGARAEMTVNYTCIVDNLTYQWYRDGKLIPDATESTWAMDPADSNADYMCHVQDLYGNNADVYFKVVIDSGLAVTAKKRDIRVIEGARAQMTVNTEYKPGTVVSYQWVRYGGYDENGDWRYDEEVIEGATQATCMTGQIMAYSEYYCVVSDQFGTERTVYFYVDIGDIGDLDTLDLPEQTLTIAQEAFAGVDCEAVIIPEGCTTIGNRAFADCANLQYVQIPSTVTSLANDAFEGCDNLTVIDDRRTNQN